MKITAKNDWRHHVPYMRVLVDAVNIDSGTSDHPHADAKNMKGFAPQFVLDSLMKGYKRSTMGSVCAIYKAAIVRFCEENKLPLPKLLMAGVERIAKAKALDYLNKNRTDDGMEPLKRVDKLWWSIHGKGWIEIQIESMK